MTAAMMSTAPSMHASRSPSAPALYPSPAPTMDDLQMSDMSGPGSMPGQLVTSSDVRMQMGFRDPFANSYGSPEAMQHMSDSGHLGHDATTPPGLGSDGGLSSCSSYTSHFEDSDRQSFDDSLEVVHAQCFSQAPGMSMSTAYDWPSYSAASSYSGATRTMMPEQLGNLDPGMIIKREGEDESKDAVHDCLGDYDDGLDGSAPGDATSTSGKQRRRSTPADKARVTCDICGTPFARTFNYNTHMATHNPHRRRPFKCERPQCDKSFYRQTDLNRHDQSVHVKSKAFQCDWCGKGFPRKDSLERHRTDGCSRRSTTRGYRHSHARRSGGGSMSHGALHAHPQTHMSAMNATTHAPYHAGGAAALDFTPSEQALRLAQPAHLRATAGYAAAQAYPSAWAAGGAQ